MEDPNSEEIDKDGFCWCDGTITGRYAADGKYKSRLEFTKDEVEIVKKKYHAKSLYKMFSTGGA